MLASQGRLGPRGWALVTLLAGGLAASLFVRPQPPQPSAVDEPRGPTGGVTGRLASSQRVALPAAAAAPTISDLDDLAPPGRAALRAGQAELPAWATPPSPLDALIAQGSAPPWHNPPAPQPLPPPVAWTNAPLPSPNPAGAGGIAPARTMSLPEAVSPVGAQLGAVSPPAAPPPSTVTGSLTRAARPAVETAPTAVAAPVLPPPPRRTPQYVFQPGYRGERPMPANLNPK